MTTQANPQKRAVSLELMGNRFAFNSFPEIYHPNSIADYEERVLLALGIMLQGEHIGATHVNARDEVYRTFGARSFPSVLRSVLMHPKPTVGLGSYGAVSQGITDTEVVGNMVLAMNEFSGSFKQKLTGEGLDELRSCIKKASNVAEVLRCVERHDPELRSMVTSHDVAQALFVHHCYEKAYRASLRTLIEWAHKTGRRIVLVTGGGPGFAMERTCQIALELRREMGLTTDTVVVVQGLGYIPRERPNGCADEGYLIRPQINFGQRWGTLNIFSSGLTKVMGGLGTAEEEANEYLQNQMCRIGGFYVIGAAATYTFDCVLTDYQCEVLQAQGLPAVPGESRIHDNDKQAMMRKVACGTAKAVDFQLGLHFYLDKGPEEQGRIMAEEHIRWALMREEAGVPEIENRALLHALNTLPKMKHGDGDFHQKLLEAVGCHHGDSGIAAGI